MRNQGRRLNTVEYIFSTRLLQMLYQTSVTFFAMVCLEEASGIVLPTNWESW